MITLRDGPAHGKTLQLQRAPYFLRVTVGDDGIIDALDQPDDRIRLHETPYCYCMVEGPARCHIRAQKPKISGWFMIATYQARPQQPPQEAMMDNARWVEWCGAHRPEGEAYFGKQPQEPPTLPTAGQPP